MDWRDQRNRLCPHGEPVNVTCCQANLVMVIAMCSKCRHCRRPLNNELLEWGTRAVELGGSEVAAAAASCSGGSAYLQLVGGYGAMPGAAGLRGGSVSRDVALSVAAGVGSVRAAGIRVMYGVDRPFRKHRW